MNPKRVLLVDDEEALRSVLKRVLETAGYEVLTAENGRAAIDRLAEQRVDVVLTDIAMPDLDGLHIIAYLRGKALPVGVIAMSGGDERNLLRARELGADRVLAKPFNCGELLGAIEECPPATWM